MDPKRWKQLEELYESALELEGDARRDFLAQQRTRDPELARELEQLLQAEPGSRFLAPPRAADLDLGSGLAGRHLGDFELVEELGRGAMGVVYVARQLGLERKVALKVLPFISGRNEEQRRRFERESKAASSLDHPHIVPIHANGEDDGLVWYAMGLVEGHDLHEEVVRQQARRQGLPHEEPLLLPPFDGPDWVAAVAERVADLADALAHAHQQGVVHRDVKPHNILVDQHGRLFLADFGLARDARFGTISKTGDLFGTPHYMSPEQARAARATVDHRTDVYSLSVVLYELLGLRRPFEGKTLPELMTQITTREPAALRRLNPRIPRDLALICAKGMSKELSERYSNAAALRDDLLRFLRHEAIEAKAPNLVTRAKRTLARHRLVSVGVAATLLATVVGIPTTWAAARLEQRRALERQIQSLLQEEDLADVEEGLVAIRKRVSEQYPSGEYPGRLGELYAELLATLEHDAQARLARGLKLRREGLGGVHSPHVFGDSPAAGSMRALLSSLAHFEGASRLHPENVEIQQLAGVESTFPTLDVVLHPTTRSQLGARTADAYLVHLDELRHIPIARQRLGPLPIVGARVPPGYHRIQVVVPGYGHAEHTRLIRFGDDRHLIEARVRALDELRAEMNSVPESVYRPIPHPPYIMGCGLLDEDRTLQGYLIDRREVSNGEYFAFLEETGHSAPRVWQDVGFDGQISDLPLHGAEDQFLSLPVVGMSWLDAREYAEWAGKRLPSHLEFELATRGVQNRYFPSSSAPYAIPNHELTRWHHGDAQTSGPKTSGVVSIHIGWRMYLENVLPVDLVSHSQEPNWLYHGYGNVAEFTESMAISEQHDRTVANPWSRTYMGALWDADQYADSLASHPMRGITDRHSAIGIGFRCAVSLSPELPEND